MKLRMLRMEGDRLLITGDRGGHITGLELRDRGSMVMNGAIVKLDERC